MPAFVDHLVIHARAGHGGRGSVHFRRVKFNPKAGPDGGDGGDGGDLVFQVDPSTDSLREFLFQSRLAAEDGRAGSERNCTGRSGKDRIYKVPPGTRVLRIEGVTSLGQAASVMRQFNARPEMAELAHGPLRLPIPGAGESTDSDDFSDNFAENFAADSPDDFSPQSSPDPASAPDFAPQSAPARPRRPRLERPLPAPDSHSAGAEANPADPNLFLPDSTGSDEPAPLPPGIAEISLVADLTESHGKFVLCAGGTGGRGNLHFTSSTNRAPTEAEPGTPGQEGYFQLELRSIADAGLVGFPNAGKSTLLGAISAAQPKIGAYPFTTLQPKVGVVDFDGWERCTIADIPGILEDAHKGKGLGLDFLRHILRCRTLLFVVDTAGTEGRHPVTDLEVLRAEVSAYSAELAARPWVILANKMDHPDAAAGLESLQDRFPRKEILPIAAANGLGLEELKRWLRENLGHRREQA